MDCKDPVTAALKVAAVEVAALNVRLQGPVPEQAPDQPANTLPALGVAVSVTVVPLLKLAVQVEPQLMPAGLLVTAPGPVLETVNCTEDGGAGTEGRLLPTPLQLLKVSTASNTSPEPNFV